MRGLILGNVDYERHMTDEGDQFQLGLAHAGWTLAGAEYGDDDRNVSRILCRCEPTHVVVHDKRDWDPESKISFRTDVGFADLDTLQTVDVVWRAVVVKDAATFHGYQERFAEEIDADALVVYYHPRSVEEHAPWMIPYKKIRTYHSVDGSFCRCVDMTLPRGQTILTGAISGSYHLRQLVRRHAKKWGVMYHRHPGYGNGGSHTRAYLRLLSRYRVHVATASNYGFALRKIIESVAMGCTPVTNLPEYDVLPAIDGALVRIPEGSRPTEVRHLIDQAVVSWDLDERMEWARMAREWYDWRAVGARLSGAAFAARRVVREPVG